MQYECYRLFSNLSALVKTKEKGDRRGIGLAAPQIGYPLRLAVIWSTGSKRFLPLINPEIVWQSKRTRLGLPNKRNPYEGCLSVPGVVGKVRRHIIIKVRYQTITGLTMYKKFKGLTGVIAQHEIDHLNGIVFTQRIAEQQGKIIKLP